MGMYTELHYNVTLNKNAEEILPVLRYMLGPRTGAEPRPLPDHPFFKCERWRCLLTMGSAYFPMDTHSTLRESEYGRPHLCVRSNIKNYCGEIEHFIDWMAPYIEQREDCVGYYRYEENIHPTIIYAPAYEAKERN
jgi:hypothetical protein